MDGPNFVKVGPKGTKVDCSRKLKVDDPIIRKWTVLNVYMSVELQKSEPFGF